MAWGNCFVRLHVGSLVSIVFLLGCSQPPVTGDIVIGRAFRPTTEVYKKELQWEQQHPENRDTSYIQQALGAGIPKHALQDGRVAIVSCSQMGNLGQVGDRYYIVLPKGVRTGESPVVVFEAVASNWDRSTLSSSYALSRFIRISDLSYHDVPAGCLWYKNGKLVEGYDGSFGWAEGQAERKKLPKLLENFRID